LGFRDPFGTTGGSPSRSWSRRALRKAARTRRHIPGMGPFGGQYWCSSSIVAS
jgi:hypothetical protein